jgi:anaerobic magnesium-protoporphyrin IX monomethyl ester cyclase
MKILLINPAAPNCAKISQKYLSIDVMGKFPPLGLLSIAAYIRNNSKHDVCIIDCDIPAKKEEDMLAFVKEYRPRVVGLTSFTYAFYDLLMMVRKIKHLLPECVIVLGGPNTSLFGREILSHSEIDYIVIGEGEKPFLRLIEFLDSNKKLNVSEGLGYRGEHGVVLEEPAVFLNLDELPFPAYDLIDLNNYYNVIGEGQKTITINSSRGCPFACVFCMVLTKKYRYHSTEYMLKLINHYYQQGIRNFNFYDDSFNITPQRVIEFSKAIQSAGMNISWIFRGRVDAISREMCRETSKAGCKQILFGIEDYKDENLRTIKKGITIEQAWNAIILAKRYGIKTSTNWILGLPPHRNTSDLNDLMKAAINLDSDYAAFNILQLLPGQSSIKKALMQVLFLPMAGVTILVILPTIIELNLTANI